MDDEEVTATGRYLFITPTLLQGINDMDTTKSKKVLEGFERVIKVPQRRFYTAIKQLSGKTGEEAGGYTKAAGAANIRNKRARGKMLDKSEQEFARENAAVIKIHAAESVEDKAEKERLLDLLGR